jgi:hypothetical protein
LRLLPSVVAIPENMIRSATDLQCGRQESRAHADYGALLQDARLLRRDIAQAIEDREIQKVHPVQRTCSYSR